MKTSNAPFRTWKCWKLKSSQIINLKYRDQEIYGLEVGRTSCQCWIERLQRNSHQKCLCSRFGSVSWRKMWRISWDSKYSGNRSRQIIRPKTRISTILRHHRCSEGNRVEHLRGKDDDWDSKNKIRPIWREDQYNVHVYWVLETEQPERVLSHCSSSRSVMHETSNQDIETSLDLEKRQSGMEVWQTNSLRVLTLFSSVHFHSVEEWLIVSQEMDSIYYNVESKSSEILMRYHRVSQSA